MHKTQVQSQGQEDPLEGKEEEMATHSSILCLENPTDRGAKESNLRTKQQYFSGSPCPQLFPN